MLAKIWSWIKKLFTKEFVGTILSKLIENAKTKITEEILNAENQEAAFNFVKELKIYQNNVDKINLFLNIGWHLS